MKSQRPISPTAAEQASDLVEAVQDDPRRRRELAAEVYEPRLGRADVRSYRRAELAFMHWQMSRGVLAPASDERPGSPWWRAVNAGLLRDACEADLLLAGAPGTPSRPAVARWRHFLESPSPASWYRAHNASIVTGYVDQRHLAGAELPVERFFMDVTLARVLFVHGLLMHPRLALGRWLWPFGRLGDPRWRGVDIYLSLKNVLPREYPLTGRSIESVLDAEDFWGRLVDYGVLMPRVQELYEYAATDLQQPHLLTFVANGNPVYTWPVDDYEAWQARRYRRLVGLVKRITPHP